MWVKICANTTLEDAQLAATLGADAVGFVFAPSIRQVTPAEVSRITPLLPEHVERIGVFPSVLTEDIEEPASRIARDAHEAKLTAVQLHGALDLSLIEHLERLLAGQIDIIQVLHWQIDVDADSSAAVRDQLKQIARQGIVQRVLIDSKTGQAIGGTGKSFNWQAAHSTFVESASSIKLIVAGGLRPENVATAIANLSPWGVDVASGVEAAPRRKDREKLTAFICNARQTKP